MTMPHFTLINGGIGRARPLFGKVAPDGKVAPLAADGFAQIVRLEHALRLRFAARSAASCRPTLAVSPGPPPRLLISDDAFVECEQDGKSCRVVIQSSRATRVILDSSDFACVEEFVSLYVLGRFFDPAWGASSS
jgi:hypothetical protein